MWRCVIISLLMMRLMKQEAQLSPRDRAMRRVNWNLANWNATVQKRQVLNKSTLLTWTVKLGRCVKTCALNSDAFESLSLSYRCHKQNRRRSSCVYRLYTDDLLWRNFLSPQCRNCSHDPDHAHLGSTHSSQDWVFTWPTRVQNLKSLALAVAEILHGV